jgi:hypothetical protein
MSDYSAFLATRTQGGEDAGFAPLWMPDFLFDFQRSLVEWALRKGRAAIFADCGLGKTPMQLVWAENVVRKTNGRVLILTPLAVGAQTLREAEKFGIDAKRSVDGSAGPGITITNYERLHHFTAADFVGVVADESSILKNFDGVRKAAVTEFMRLLPYRLLCTATAAPNDYVELGTSSEALGALGHMDMLTRFFRNQNNNAVDTRGHWRGFAAPRAYEQKQWRFKHHAEQPFWRWVCSWARACRRPSDIGFGDGAFVLPPLDMVEHVVTSRLPREDLLFDLPAIGLREELAERRRTIPERCELVASLVNHTEPALIWCQLNEEGDALVRLIPDAEQVSGADADEDKEAKLTAFVEGRLRVLVTKHKIGAWGLNLQHCRHITDFPSHSYEQHYQGIRRCWRFPQTLPVRVDIVATEGQKGVRDNLARKALAADRMFAALVQHMNRALLIDNAHTFTDKEEVPAWLSASKL